MFGFRSLIYYIKQSKKSETNFRLPTHLFAHVKFCKQNKPLSSLFDTLAKNERGNKWGNDVANSKVLGLHFKNYIDEGLLFLPYNAFQTNVCSDVTWGWLFKCMRRSRSADREGVKQRCPEPGRCKRNTSLPERMFSTQTREKRVTFMWRHYKSAAFEWIKPSRYHISSNLTTYPQFHEHSSCAYLDVKNAVWWCDE